MATDQELVRLMIRLTANVGELKTELNGANSAISGFVSGAKTLLKGITFIAVVNELKNMITGAVEAGQELEKVAERLGMTTAKLAEMKYAAFLADVEFDELQVGLKLLARNMQNAADGTGTAAGALKAMGLDAVDPLTKRLKPMDQMIDEIADKFATYRESAERTALAQELFGRSGNKMIPMLIGGAAGMKASADEGRKLGAVMGDDLIQKAVMAEAQWKRFKSVTAGVSNQFANDLLPAVTSLLGGITTLAVDTGAVHAVFTALAVVLATLADGAFTIAMTFKLAGHALGGFAAIAFEVMRGNFAGARDMWSQLTDQIAADIADNEKKLTAWNIATGKNATAVSDAVKKAGKGTENAPLVSEKSDAAADKMITKVQQLKAEMTALVRPIEGSRLALEAWIADTIKEIPLTARTERLRKEMDNVRAAFNAYQAAVQKKASVEGLDTLAFSKSTQAIENELQQLETDYAAALIAEDQYFTKRRALIQASGAAEQALLTNQLSRVEAGDVAKRMELEQKIFESKEKTGREVVKINAAESASYRQLWATISEGMKTESIDKIEAMLDRVDAAYADGLVTIKDYYNQRRAAVDTESTAEIEDLQNQFDAATTFVEKEKILNQIRSAERKRDRDEAKLDRDQTLAYRQQAIDIMDLAILRANVNTRAELPGSDAAMQTGFIEQQLQMVRTQAEEEKKIRQMAMDDTMSDEEKFYARKLLLDDLYAKQKKEKDILLFTQEQQLNAMRLERTSAVVGGIGNIFGQMYEMSGRKLKAFFYLEKAAAIAQAYINTALAATKAMGQTGVFGIPMVPVIWALGAAQIAMIMAQTFAGPGKRLGGLITDGSGVRDDVPVRVMRGEYIQPSPVVRYYGPGVMEAMRRMLIPRSVFEGFATYPALAPAHGRFATGGMVTGDGEGSRTINVPVTVENNDARLAATLRANIEDVVVKTLKEYSRQ